MKNPQFILNYDVMYYDTDCGGVVHNLAYLRWVEECRTKMAPNIGIDFIGLIQENRHLVLVSHEVQYKRPAFMGDKIQIHAWVEKVEKSRFWCVFEIRRDDGQQVCVKVRQCLALVQMPQGRPQRIPEAWYNSAAPAEDLED